jgi:hypothetical protein
MIYEDSFHQATSCELLEPVKVNNFLHLVITETKLAARSSRLAAQGETVCQYSNNKLFLAN